MDKATLHLLARVYVRYRGGLDVNFPECQDIERILNEAGSCNVADMRNPNIVALFAPEVSEVKPSVVLGIPEFVETAQALIRDSEPPTRKRRKPQDEGTDEGGE